MSKHVFEFDFTRFGCNEEAVKDLVQEIMRRLPHVEWDYSSANRAHLARKMYALEVRNPQPKGVRVKVGQRVMWGDEEVTMAPRLPERDARFYFDDGGTGRGHWTNITTKVGQPVLGYEDDA